MKKEVKFILLTTLIFLLALSQAACRTATKLTAKAVIEKAYGVTLDIASFHVTICSDNSNNYENEQCIEGDFLYPDRMRILMDTDEQKGEFLIIIGNKMYERDFQTGEWQLYEDRSAQAAQQSVQRLAEEIQPKSIAEKLKELVVIEELPKEVINGIDCVHYKGEIDPLKELREQLDNESDPLVKETLREMIVTQQQAGISMIVEFWIGKDDYLVRQLQKVQSWSYEGTTMTLTSIIKFSKFNESVEIEPPL